MVLLRIKVRRVLTRTFEINKLARQGRANETPRTSAGLIAILLLMYGWEIRIYTVTFEGIHAMQGTFGKFCTCVPGYKVHFSRV